MSHKGIRFETPDHTSSACVMAAFTFEVTSFR